MKWRILALFLLFSFSGTGQNDSSVFNRITKEMGTFKPNFSVPPADKTTSKIRELRNLKGGFNIREAIAFKLEEDRKQNKMPETEWKELSTYMTTGKGAGDIDNAVIWIYRDNFSYEELKRLVRFYKTPAGKKMNELFPFVMLKSLAVAEIVKEQFSSKK